MTTLEKYICNCSDSVSWAISFYRSVSFGDWRHCRVLISLLATCTLCQTDAGFND